MIRYFRLYAHFVRFSFSRAMEFRVDFLFRIAMDCLFYAVQFAFFGVLYRHTTLLGGWNQDQIWVFLGGVFVTDAAIMTVFANNTWWFPLFVNRGDLDYYLVRPVSSLFFLNTRDFAANSFFNLLISTGLLAWALLHYPEPLAAGNVLLYLFLLGSGILLVHGFHLCFLIPVFWIQSTRGLDEMYWVAQHLMERPDRIYRGWLHRILVSIVPLALVISYPTSVLFGAAPLRVALHVLGATAVMWLITWRFWRWGIRSYASASS
jgi:ABC-2 type transport system permease protein